MQLSPRLLPGPGPARRELVLAVALGALAAVCVVLQAEALSRSIDAVFLGKQGVLDVAPWLLGLAAAAVARAACGWRSDVLAARAAGRVRVFLRTRLTRHLFDLGPSFSAGERSGELLYTLTGGVEATDAYLSQYLPQLALALLVPAIVLGFVLATDPLSALVLGITFPLVPFFMALLGDAARRRSQQQFTTLARLSAAFLEGLQGLATLKALGRAEQHLREIAAATERFREVTMGVLRIAFLSALVLELIATLATAIVAVEVGLRLLYGWIGFRAALFVLMLAPEFYRPLRALGSAFHAGMAGTEAAQRIFSVLEVQPALANGSRPAPDAAPAIAFDGVGFAYAPGDTPALEAVSFRIEPGTTLALVGPSGAGKSTAGSLLLRFLEPTCGQIRIDGETLAEIGLEAWRGRVAWLPQRPRLFHGSVRDNLLLARPGAPHAAVEHAARLAYADGFIRALPQGYDTEVGEDGARLSGGQAQRLALARAFLKDAPVLVLDEPTSQLDAESEELVHEAMQRLLAGRSVLLIAHRLRSVRHAARIVLLAGGRVVEAGTHAELALRGGAYARLLAAYTGAA